MTRWLLSPLVVRARPDDDRFAHDLAKAIRRAFRQKE
jgi:hypothetical protein